MPNVIRTMLICCLIALASFSAQPIHAQEPPFEQHWRHADYPVRQGVAPRSWTWGPVPITAQLREAFADAQDGRRQVQYFDKGRMELMPDGSLTSGLLVRELIEGRVQTGLDRFIPLGPAQIAAVGDLNNAFPTYADLQRIYRRPNNRPLGERVTALLAPDGDGTMLRYASATASEIVRQEGGFGIPRALWLFMNQRGVVFENGQYRASEPVFDWRAVVGLPVTEAYWTNVQLGGVEQPVLFQAFERRVLTYTPSNPSAMQVEMGNVGQHYYQWRYLDPFADGARAVVTVPTTEGVAPVVQSPLLVQGFESGNAFEGTVVVRLRNVAEGVLVARSAATVQRPEMGMAGPFSVTLIFTPPLTNTAVLLEVIALSPQNGTETILDQRVVVLRAASAVPLALVDQVRQHLAARLGLGLAEIAVVETRYIEWPDAALGCPEPGLVYPQVITPGYQIVLGAQGQQYAYHTDTLDAIVLCLGGRPAVTAARLPIIAPLA